MNGLTTTLSAIAAAFRERPCTAAVLEVLYDALAWHPVWSDDGTDPLSAPLSLLMEECASVWMEELRTWVCGTSIQVATCPEIPSFLNAQHTYAAEQTGRQLRFLSSCNSEYASEFLLEVEGAASLESRLLLRALQRMEDGVQHDTVGPTRMPLPVRCEVSVVDLACRLRAAASSFLEGVTEEILEKASKKGAAAMQRQKEEVRSHICYKSSLGCITEKRRTVITCCSCQLGKQSSSRD